MGNRLSKIYTRTGDDGTTGLSSGIRIEKDDKRIEAIGAIDELNSAIGLVISSSIPDELKLVLEKIQQELFNLGGELSMPDSEMINSDAIKYLESALDKLNDKLTALKNFVLPGGSRSAANCHIARAICRRAERRLLGLSRISRVNKNSLRYLNRLSDLLFVIARSINKYEGAPEILWKQNQS